MSTKTLTEHLRDQLAAGWYEAIERKQFGWLWCRLPEVYKDKDDVAAQIRMYSLEAANMYDPDRGASFTTFFTHHLRQRTINWQQYLWQRSPAAKNGASFAMHTVESATFYAKGRVEGGGEVSTGSDLGEHRVLASVSSKRHNGRSHAVTQLSTRAVAENHARLGEIMNRLSDDAKSFIDKLLAFPDQDRLLIMLGSSRYKHWLRTHLEMTNEQISALYSEVRSKAAFAI